MNSFSGQILLWSNKNAALLDIGPGRGEMLSLWAEKGYVNIYGIDISEEVISVCRRVSQANLAIVSDLTGFLSCHKASLDLITLLDVVEHLPYDQLFDLGEPLFEAPLPNGVLIVQTCNMASPSSSVNRYLDITHQQGFTDESLTQWLRFAGFKNVEIGAYEEPVESVKGKVRLKLRNMYYRWVRLTRLLEHSANPTILTPVIWAVGKKGLS